MKSSKIALFPVSFFSVIMGLTGTAIAFQKADLPGSTSVPVSLVLLLTAFAVFLLILAVYLVKMVFHFSAVQNEFRHPVKISFFPTISVSVILFSVALRESAPFISLVLVSIGATLHLAFSLLIISEWIKQDKFEIKHMNPAWFIPAVGNMLVPVAGVGQLSPFVCWFFFSVGLMFWIILFVLFFYRIVFHHPLQEKLVPTLFILIAPPSVGFISYFKLTGGFDAFSYILYGIALFLFLLLFFMGKMFLKIRFYLSWWAFSFPIAALTIASFLMYHHEKIILFQYFGFFLLAALSLLILFLAARTVIAVVKNGICVEEE